MAWVMVARVSGWFATIGPWCGRSIKRNALMNSSGKLINASSRQLLAFLEICRLGSFARAAESVHLSPSGLSMLVKELEEQIGARLFDRNTRSIALTDAGRRVRPSAERIVEELRVLGASIQGSEAAVRARLDIAATPMMSASLLPRVLREFAVTHPGVRVQLDDVDVSTVRSRVLEGRADIGFGFFVRPAVGLLRQPLCQFRLMRISPPNGRRKAVGLGASQPWTSLAALPLVSLPSDNPIQVLIEKQLGRVGRSHEERPRANLLGTLLGMVEAGLGHAVMPSFALNECLRRGLGVALLVEPAVQLDLFLVARRGTRQKPAALAFAATLKEAASMMTD
jgi:LysR family transcriptional regulator, carnitine catabolism transcriptional activator